MEQHEGAGVEPGSPASAASSGAVSSGRSGSEIPPTDAGKRDQLARAKALAAAKALTTSDIWRWARDNVLRLDEDSRLHLIFALAAIVSGYPDLEAAAGKEAQFLEHGAFRTDAIEWSWKWEAALRCARQRRAVPPLGPSIPHKLDGYSRIPKSIRAFFIANDMDT